MIWVLTALAGVAEAATDCADAYQSCYRWARQNTCTQPSTASFMRVECPASCGQCGGTVASDPCSPVRDAAGPGDVRMTFDRVLARGELKASVLSADPYILLLDHFAHGGEAAVWAEAASASGGFGSNGSSCGHKGMCNSTSMSCLPVAGATCWEQGAMRQLESRMLDVVGLPAENSEPLRFVLYTPGQTFGPHHDAAGQGGIPPHTPGGPRVWTLYTFLTDVEAGGALRFPALNLSVEAVAGRAVLWPHLRDNDLLTVDERTVHEGAPLLRGRKMGVNLHAHRNNLRTRILAGCAHARPSEAGEAEAISVVGGDGSGDGMGGGGGSGGGGGRMSHVFHYESTPGATPLHDLIGLHAIEPAARLLRAGAHVYACMRTCTHAHMHACALACMRTYALTCVHVCTCPEEAPCAYACMHACMHLLHAGAPADATDSAGSTALHVAAGRDLAKIVVELIAAGATVDAANVDGATPCMGRILNPRHPRHPFRPKVGSRPDGDWIRH